MDGPYAKPFFTILNRIIFSIGRGAIQWAMRGVHRRKAGRESRMKVSYQVRPSLGPRLMRVVGQLASQSILFFQVDVRRYLEHFTRGSNIVTDAALWKACQEIINDK